MRTQVAPSSESLHVPVSFSPARPACARFWIVSPQRPGFSMFEMLLVLGLLVAMAAIAWPAVEGSFASARLRAAADKVRAAWSDARLEAMRTGVIHEFRYMDAGSSFQVRSWSSLAEAIAPPAEEAIEGGITAAFDRTLLPSGVVFAPGTANIDHRATLTAAVAGANLGAEGVYSPPILFYPDGTSVDAVLYLKNEHDIYLRIALRGLTGISRASGLLTADQL